MTPVKTAAARTAEGAIVFTDIVGFTEFTALRGDDAALDLLSAQDRIVQETLDEKGRVVKALGDGLMLWFSDACTAVRTALKLQERFEKHSQNEDTPLWVRMGVHYGRAAQRGEDLIGHDVNVAARIVTLAAPGEVLISETCTPEVGDAGDIELEEVGPTVMKGIPDPVSLYRATWA